MVRSVIFDLDGTLLDTLKDLGTAGNHTLSAMGFPTHPLSAYQRFVGKGIDNLVVQMLPEQNRGEATIALASNIFRNYYTEHMDDFTVPYPGILALLDTLKSHGIRIGITSNKKHAYTAGLAAKHFAHRVDAVLGACKEFPIKPDPAIVFEMMRLLQAEKSTTWYVGDSDVDMITAANAGLVSVGVLWGFRSREELLHSGAQHLAASAEELLGLLLSAPV